MADQHRLVDREQEVEVLISQMRLDSVGVAPVTWLVGDGGVGKTSLVMAGVVPRVEWRAGARGGWIRIVSDADVQGLIERIAFEVLGRIGEEQESTLDRDGRLRQFRLLLRQDSPESAADFLASCLRGAGSNPPGARCLIFVDQFERALRPSQSGESEGLPAVLQFLRDLCLTGVFSCLVAVRPGHEERLSAAWIECGGEDGRSIVRIGPPSQRATREFFSGADLDSAPGGRIRVAPSLRETLCGAVERWPGALPFASRHLAGLARAHSESPEIGLSDAERVGGLGGQFAAAFQSVGIPWGKPWEDLFAALHPSSGDLDAPVSVQVESFVDGSPERRELVEALEEALILRTTFDDSGEKGMSWAYGPGLSAWEVGRAWVGERRRLDGRIQLFERSHRRWVEEGRSRVCLIHASTLIKDARTLLGDHVRWPRLTPELVTFLEESIALDERIRGEWRARRLRKVLLAGSITFGSALALLLALMNGGG